MLFKLLWVLLENAWTQSKIDLGFFEEDFLNFLRRVFRVF